MTADVELPPPWQCETAMCPDLYTAGQVRACVAHATAAKDAEIEALREALDWTVRQNDELLNEGRELTARAGRLSEALQEIEGFTLSQFAGPHDMAAACIERASRALLREQEEGRE